MATRLLDISLSLGALVIASPLLVLIALAVTLDSPGPALHRARRVGQGGRIFTLYKFRTMVSGAQGGPAITRRDDPRVTRIGRVLRRTKLDELPQLVNTLVGTMSLVGPRPEDPVYVRLYSPDQRRVLDAKPGLTSPATILHRNEEGRLAGPDWERTYRTQILPEKLRLELDYLSRRTLGRDLRVIVATGMALLRPARLSQGRLPWGI